MNFRQNTKQIKADAVIRKYMNLLRKSCKQIDIDAFLESNPSVLNQILNSKDAHYLLDISTMSYVFLNDKFAFITGYDNAILIKDKWRYPEKLVLEEDKLAVCVVLKEYYSQLKSLKPGKRKTIIGEISYRLENKNGEIHKILQEFVTIALDREGLPSLEMGTLKVITHHKKDNAVTGTINDGGSVKPIEPIKLLPALKPYTVNQATVAALVQEGMENTDIEQKTGFKVSDIETIRKGIIQKEGANNMINAIFKKNNRGA